MLVFFIFSSQYQPSGFFSLRLRKAALSAEGVKWSIRDHHTPSVAIASLQMRIVSPSRENEPLVTVCDCTRA